MNIMKDSFKFFILIGIVFVVLFFVSCRSKEESNSKEHFKIVTTIFPEYDFVRQLTDGVEDVEVLMLSSPGVDVHSFEPTPKNMVDVKNANMFVYQGGKNERWVEKIMSSFEDKNCVTVSLVEALKQDKDLEKDIKNGEDTHLWTSPLNCIKIVEHLGKRLCDLDKKNCSKYEENKRVYLEKLKNLDKGFKDVVKDKKRNFVVIADQFPFYYLFKHYGLDYISPFKGCSSKNEPISCEVSELIEKVKKDKIPFVLKMEGTHSDVAKTVSEACNVDVLTLNSCHSCSKKDFAEGKTFLNFYEENLETLKKALS